MCTLGYQRTLRVERMGRVDYRPMLALQQARHAEVVAGERDDTLFLVEHPPVITLGRNHGGDHLRADAAALAARGIDVIETGRGGDITFHGPGQWLGYPIVHLDGGDAGERDIKRFVGLLEEVMIRTAADAGVRARRKEGMRGVWVGDAKLGAVGVRVARWTTLHGFALNVTTDLRDFEMIVPCGLHGYGVTSLAAVVGEIPSTDEILASLAFHTASLLNRRPVDRPPTPVGSPARPAPGQAQATA